MITGRESLKRIDRVIVRLRRQLSEAIDAAEDARSRRALIGKEQVAAFQELAKLRADQLAAGRVTSKLSAAEKKAVNLLAAHADFILESQRRLQDAANEILRLEEKRNALSQNMDEVVEAYEKRVESIKSALEEDEDYLDLKSAYERAEIVSERAHSKLAIACEDREAKGRPYDADPLFSYLWQRRYGTPAYKTSPFFRFLDGWVARLCRYDDARLNYKRLTELPVRLEEHAARQDGLRDEAESALENAEAEALANGGADALENEVDELRKGVEGVDHLISRAETRHQELAKSHESALASQSGPAMQAQAELAQALQDASFPDLRILASQTLEQDDDDVVDRLVKLRAEEMELELSNREIDTRPVSRRKELEVVEAFRRAFKSTHFDSPYATFSGSSIDAAMSRLLRDGESVRGAMRFIEKHMRRTAPRVDPGFGGGRRAETLGLPGVFGDIAIEIAKEAARQGGRYGGYRGPRRKPWRTKPTRRSFPRPGPRTGGRSGGGFKTGGGF